jgi:DnaJ-class molecular chaperone
MIQKIWNYNKYKEIEEICESCWGSGELYFKDVHEMLQEMWEFWFMGFKELRKLAREYKKKGYITCPNCHGEGTIVYRV